MIVLCLGPVLTVIFNSLKETARKLWWIPVLGAFLLVFYMGYQEVRGSLYQTRMEDPAVAREIGETVQHSPHTVYVAYYYGVPLEYYGEFGGAPWPVRIEDQFYRQPGAQELSVQERLEGLGFTPEYFVITNFDLYHHKHPDLQSYLEDHCSMLKETGDYLIYKTCGNE